MRPESRIAGIIARALTTTEKAQAGRLAALGWPASHRAKGGQAEDEENLHEPGRRGSGPPYRALG